MTETSPCAIVTPHEMSIDKTGSTGILVAATEAKVIDMITGEKLPQNQNGELCIRGPQVKISKTNFNKITKKIYL